MRALVFALALAGCTNSNGIPAGNSDLAGADFAGVDFAGVDLASGSTDLAAPVPDFSATDLAGVSCVTLCQHCTLGGACCPGAPNGGCCGSGEWCDNGTCRCGSRGSCGAGMTCASGGPAPGLIIDHNSPRAFHPNSSQRS